MANSNEITKPVMVLKIIHNDIRNKAVWNDVKIFRLASALLECMLQNHPDEVEEIIKKLKMKK